MIAITLTHEGRSHRVWVNGPIKITGTGTGLQVAGAAGHALNVDLTTTAIEFEHWVSPDIRPAGPTIFD